MNKPPEGLLLAAQDALVEMHAYLGKVISEKTRRPGGDLISRLVNREGSERTVSRDELVSTSVTFLVAGHETTTSLIGNSLYQLLTQGDLWTRLQCESALLGTALEETLRLESPVARQARVVMHDTDLGGKPLRAGDVVMQMLNSANRDPRQFPEAGAFDPARHPNRHIAFRQGIHFCVGAPLSRLEGDVVFTTLLREAPTIRLVDAHPSWSISKPNSRVLTSIPVTF